MSAWIVDVEACHLTKRKPLRGTCTAVYLRICGGPHLHQPIWGTRPVCDPAHPRIRAACCIGLLIIGVSDTWLSDTISHFHSTDDQMVETLDIGTNHVRTWSAVGIMSCTFPRQRGGTFWALELGRIAMPGATSSFLLLIAMPLFLVASCYYGLYKFWTLHSCQFTKC